MEMIIAALVGIGIGILIGSLIAKNKRQAPGNKWNRLRQTVCIG